MITALVILSILGVLFLAAVRTGRKWNRIDWGISWLNCVDGLLRAFCVRYHRLQSSECTLPATGPALVASNHVSGLDPFLLIASSKRPLRFLMAVEEYQRFGLQWLFKAAGCVPVEREARPELALRQAVRLLKKGEVVAIFPHGKIHLDSDPPRPLKKGVVRLAQLTNAPVVTARIDGVAGEGTVVEAVLKRSRAVVKTFPTLAPPHPDADEIAKSIEHYISLQELPTE